MKASDQWPLMAELTAAEMTVRWKSGGLRGLTLMGVRDGEAGGMFQPLFSITILCSSSCFGARVAQKRCGPRHCGSRTDHRGSNLGHSWGFFCLFCRFALTHDGLKFISINRFEDFDPHYCSNSLKPLRLTSLPNRFLEKSEQPLLLKTSEARCSSLPT